ncbi:MAG: hypothetical protein AAGE94_26150 [Acidobacteriota bacterium]
MSDETHATDEPTAEATAEAAESHTDDSAPLDEPPAPDTDGKVDALWSVAVLPGESVSIHYRVTPSDASHSIRSLSTSFAWAVHGMIEHTFAGSTTNETMEPRDGQGAVGDMGVDLTVFSNLPESSGQLEAVLAGVVDTGEGSANFLFTKPVHLPDDDES